MEEIRSLYDKSLPKRSQKRMKFSTVTMKEVTKTWKKSLEKMEHVRFKDGNVVLFKEAKIHRGA